MYETVFISHSKFDEEFGKEIEDVIREGGYIAWRFQRDMQGGKSWPPQLPTSIEWHGIFLYIATAYAQLSVNCQRELQHAALLSKRLVTVTTHPRWIPPPPLDDHQAVYYDGSGKAVARLMQALQVADPIDPDRIPEDWSKWDCTSKSKPAIAIQEDHGTPPTEIDRDLAVVEKRDLLHSAIVESRSIFEASLDKLTCSDSRIEARIGHDTTSGFASFISIDGQLAKGCRVFISADNDGLTYDGNTHYAVQWDVDEIRRHMRDTDRQISDNLQAVIDGDSNAAAFVRSLERRNASLRDQLKQSKRIQDQLQHLSVHDEGGEFYTLRAIVGKLNGEPVLKFLPTPLMPNTMSDSKVCNFGEAAKILANVFIGDLRGLPEPNV